MEELLLYGANSALVSVLFGLSMILTMIFPSLTKSKMGKRIYPVITIALGVIGGFVYAPPPPINQIFVGLVSGASAALILAGLTIDRLKLLGKSNPKKEDEKKDE